MFLIFFLIIIKIHTFVVSESISIKCSNNITLGDLVLDDEMKLNLSSVFQEILKLENSTIHYSKYELDNEANILSSELHPFVSAIHVAYANHLKLILTPDIIWYLIISGTANHVNKHSEELRYTFVEHSNKKTINIQRQKFLFNSSSNEWESVIDEFVEKIEFSLKPEAKNLFNATFNTTNRVNSLCSKIVLMSAMEKYFTYKLTTLCGIPEIILQGTINDWKLIKEKILRFSSEIPSLNTWYIQLIELIQKFIDVYDNRVDYDFWNKIYKVNGGSGGPYISGWLLALFPYLKNNSKNYFVWEKDWKFAYELNYMSGLVTSDFPMTLTNASFIWQYHSFEYSMSFLGGLVGVQYEENLKTLQPIFGYAVIQN